MYKNKISKKVVDLLLSYATCATAANRMCLINTLNPVLGVPKCGTIYSRVLWTRVPHWNQHSCVHCSTCAQNSYECVHNWSSHSCATLYEHWKCTTMHKIQMMRQCFVDNLRTYTKVKQNTAHDTWCKWNSCLYAYDNYCRIRTPNLSSWAAIVDCVGYTIMNTYLCCCSMW